MRLALLQFIRSGWANAFRLRSPATEPASNLTWTLPSTIPGSTQALTCDSAGNLGYASLGVGGSVSSVDVTGIAGFITTSGGPVTVSGAISLALATQSLNTVLAGPTSGGAAAPTFRGLVANDIPTLTTGKLSDFAAAVAAFRLDQFAAPTANVNFNNQRATGLADPIGSQDAATKAYADALISTGNNKGTARGATTASLALTSANATSITKTGGLPTSGDGVTYAPGDIILVKDEIGAGATGAAANGLYVYAAGTTWNRATNADISAEVRAGLFVFVSEGTAVGNSGWTLTTDDPITLGTTQLVFAQTSGAGQIVDGNGLTKTGNVLDVNVDNSTIEISADALRVKDLGITASKLADGSVDLSGTKIFGVLQVASGGTGGFDASTARGGIGAAGSYLSLFADANLTAGVLLVTHNLGAYPVVQVIDDTGKMIIPDDITGLNDSSTCSVDLTTFGTLSGFWAVRAVR